MEPDPACPAITIRFALPKPELRPLITTYYRTDVVTTDVGGKAEDWLHPEWPNLRFTSEGLAQAGIGRASLETCPSFTVNGPTSRATHFTMRTVRVWGIGFTPKLLLRRQRFLRSLVQFMLDPSLKWLSTVDGQYHDQAHFVRDFKRFMGMSPSAYAKLDKPMLIAAARARMAIAGEAMQGLHAPDAPA